jgi:UDP-N-acetylglucosamine pyrophosphorylase
MRTHFNGSLASFRFASMLKEEDLAKLGLEEQDAELFIDMVQHMAQQKERLSSVKWEELAPVDIESLAQYDRLASVGDEDKCDVLSRFAIVKLNGGVGSTMGLKKPKALLTINYVPCVVFVALFSLFVTG